MFTIPKVLRGIFRKRRHRLTHLFHTATATLQDAFRIRLSPKAASGPSPESTPSAIQ